jgi:hypothetical protein
VTKELNALTKDLFHLHDYEYEQNVTFNHTNNEPIEVSFVINGIKQNQRQFKGKTGVLIENKTSIRTIIKADKIKEETQLSRMIVVSEKFPSEVKELADKLGIITFSKHELNCIKSLYELTAYSNVAFDV